MLTPLSGQLSPLTRPRGTPRLPRTIANLALWLDASVGLTQNSDGSAPVSSDGDPVGYWADQSGNNKNAVQNTNTTFRPLYKVSILNGRPAVRFDGVNDTLRVLSLGMQTFFTLIFVGRFTTAKPPFIEHSVNANSNDGCYIYGATNAMLHVRRASIHSVFGSASWLGSASHIVMGRYDGAHLVRLDGTPAANGTILGTARADSLITTDLFICSRNQAGNFGDGDLFELLVYNRALTSAEQNTLGAYLAAKYALTWTV